jgi:hypothetical protein
MRQRGASVFARLLVPKAVVIGAAVAVLAAVVPTTTAGPARAGTEDPDKPFSTPQYLIHITGHGTTSGDVKDDALVIFPTEPDGEGHFLSADGSGGTIGWGSDFHSGPYNKPSEVCAAAGAKLDPSGYIGSLSGINGVDCNSLKPGGGTTPIGSTDTSTVNSSTGSSTPTTSDAPACNVRGQVTDAFGDPVADIHIIVNAGGLSLDTATLADGSYSFDEIGDDPAGGVFDSRVDSVRVSLVAEEQAHSPQRFLVFYRQNGVSLGPEPFMIPDDGDCQFDFDMRSIPSNYVSNGAPIADWPSITQIYQGIYHAWALADLLNIDITYGLPLQVLSWCDDATYLCTAKSGTFFLGSRSDGAVTVDRPYIAISPQDSRITSGNRYDNREYHEFGHYVLASAFNGNPDKGADVSHAGYANASSSDSWSEGFAEFWAAMVAKYIDHRPDYDLYRWAGGTLDLSRPWQAWEQEELAVSSLLVRLEALNINPAPPPPRTPRTFKVEGYTEVNDPTFGRLIIGRVLNLTPDGTSFGTVAGATFYDANRQPIDSSFGTTIPPDLGANGGEGLFVLAVPKNITYKDLSINVYEGRPKPPDPAAQPFDVSLEEIWAAITAFHSNKELSAGHVFDVDDLYQALKAAFGGRGAVAGGLDTIDQLFIKAGFFDDPDGNRAFAPDDAIGPTSHPAFGDQASCQVKPKFGCSPPRVPRTDYGGIEGFIANVSILGDNSAVIPDAEVYAQVVYPAPSQGSSYGYTVVPDELGAVSVSVPDPNSGAMVVLIAVANGHMPRVLGTIDPTTFWTDAATHDGPFLSYSATLPTGDLTIPTGAGGDPTSAGSSSGSASGASKGKAASRSTSSIAILIAGLVIPAFVGVALGRRRRRRGSPVPTGAAPPPAAPPPGAPPPAPPPAASPPTNWGPPS